MYNILNKLYKIINSFISNLKNILKYIKINKIKK